MVPDTLYYPIDSKFPAVEFLFVKNEAGVETNQLFGIQVTYSSTHRKEKQVYTKLLERLCSDAITIYIISKPSNTERYAIDPFGKLCASFSQEDMPNLHFKVVKCDWTPANVSSPQN